MSFSMGGNERSKKIAWIKWSTICKNKEFGGLNVKDLESFNLSLFLKWKWRILQGGDTLWRDIIDSKYGLQPSLNTQRMSNRPSPASFWWRDLQSLQNLSWFDEGVRRSVGNGRETSFWNSIWIGNEPLRLRFNRLFIISTDKESSLAEKGEWQNGSWNWIWHWRRTLFQWEQTLFTELLKVLDGFCPKDENDSWRWIRDPSGSYSVHSAYAQINYNPNDVNDPLMMKLWTAKVPLKVVAFIWKAMYDRIPTRMNLLKRGVSFTGSDINCGFCGVTTEITDHIFFECSFPYQLWMEVYNWFGFSTAITRGMKSHFLQNIYLWPKRKGREAWMVVWFAVIWLLWKARNKIIFENVQPDPLQLLDDVKAVSWTWIKAKGEGSSYSFVDWLSFPKNCIS